MTTSIIIINNNNTIRQQQHEPVYFVLVLVLWYFGHCNGPRSCTSCWAPTSAPTRSRCTTTACWPTCAPTAACPAWTRRRCCRRRRRPSASRRCPSGPAGERPSASWRRPPPRRCPLRCRRQAVPAATAVLAAGGQAWGRRAFPTCPVRYRRDRPPRRRRRVKRAPLPARHDSSSSSGSGAAPAALAARAPRLLVAPRQPAAPCRRMGCSGRARLAPGAPRGRRAATAAHGRLSGRSRASSSLSEQALAAALAVGHYSCIMRRPQRSHSSPPDSRHQDRKLAACGP